jgi:protein-S-isoprenylcysteine O-methyltransferase Ste14
VLAAVFLGSGVLKLVRTKPQLASAGQGWVEAFPAGTTKLIGVLEVVAGVGLVLPAALSRTDPDAYIAAVGLIVVMAGAVVTHARRHEMPNVAVNIVLAVLAAVVAWGRFGPYSF